MLQHRIGALRVRGSSPVYTHSISAVKVEKSDVKIGAFAHLC